MNREELQDRTKQFALRVIKLSNALPNNVTGRTIKNQLIRCGTSVGANYRAACRGRSRSEFMARLAVAEEEADESIFWMELIIEANLMRKQLIEPLLTEADELTAILAATIISTKKTL